MLILPIIIYLDSVGKPNRRWKFGGRKVAKSGIMHHTNSVAQPH